MILLLEKRGVLYKHSLIVEFLNFTDLYKVEELIEIFIKLLKKQKNADCFRLCINKFGPNGEWNEIYWLV